MTGRWTFSSGCCYAIWLAGFATLVEDGRPRCRPDGMLEARYMLFPKSDATIIDAWHVRGLRGTGSHLRMGARCQYTPGPQAELFHRLPIRDHRHGPKSTVARLISGMVGCFAGAWSIMAMSPSASTVSSIVQP
ncbi:MAG: hypothetical protein ACRERE_33455 [Candidatus Entotheonellia bacterium]